MLEPLGKLFADKKTRAWQPSDARIVIENWLREALASDQIYCVAVSNSRATVRVGSPALYQEVRLREYDLIAALAQELGYTVSSLTLIPAYA